MTATMHDLKSESPIHGVQWLPGKMHPDERGAFAEIWRLHDFAPKHPAQFQPVQANLSISMAGTCRGMHWHYHQADLWWVCSGSAVVSLYDMRRGSPTQGHKERRVLQPSDAVYIPPGVAHGFRAMMPLVLCYLVDRYYEGGADEQGYSIDWGTGAPVIVSDRDRDAPKLEELREDMLPVWQGSPSP